MNDVESWVLRGHTLEYLDDIHQYLVDGIMESSITQMLKMRFGNKYAGIDALTLQRASERGTEIHRAIELYCKTVFDKDIKEVHNFKFLKKQYAFNVIDNELPVILFDGDEAISAGRLDMVLSMADQIGLADIKTTSTLDKEYLGLQLNLYRIAYMQTYGGQIEFLRGIHLRDDVRKFVSIPINEDMTWEFINEWRGKHED